MDAANVPTGSPRPKAAHPALDNGAMPTLASDTPPRDSASLVMVRDGADGLEVLLLRRSGHSPVAANFCVFPGGKLEAGDMAPALLARLDTPPAALAQALDEPALPPERAAGLYVTALREAAEEARLLCVAGDLAARTAQDACAQLHAGASFGAVMQALDRHLAAHALVPWSRWITPPHQSFMERRFDTRFFLVGAPTAQSAAPDAFEVTTARWWSPAAALTAYRERTIKLIPPQIMGLLELTTYVCVADALAAARGRRPPCIQPLLLERDGGTVMCYPGDPEHPVQAPRLPDCLPTRLVLRDGLADVPRI